MTEIIIIAVVVFIIWGVKKLSALFDPSSVGSAEFQSQVKFLNAYMRYSQTPACNWILDCSNKKELIENGQDRLWAATKKFHANMDELSKNGFRIQKNDTAMLEHIFEIVSTAHLMHAAESGHITFKKLLSDTKSEDKEPNE